MPGAISGSNRTQYRTWNAWHGAAVRQSQFGSQSWHSIAVCLPRPVPVVRMLSYTSGSFAFLYQWFVCFPIPVVRLLFYTSRSFALYQWDDCFPKYAGPTGHACHAICRSNRTCLSCNMPVQQDMPVMKYAVPARHACHEICRSSKTCLS